MKQQDIVALEISLLVSAVKQVHGYDFSGYASASLTRPVRAWLAGQCGVCYAQPGHRRRFQRDALDRVPQRDDLFMPVLKERLRSLFDGCLRPGGFLCLGIKGTLEQRGSAPCYREVAAPARIYRKQYGQGVPA